MIIDNPVAIALGITGGIIVCLYIVCRLKPLHRLVTVGLLVVALYLWYTKSPEEGGNDLRTADTLRILATNRRALADWYRQAGDYPPPGADGLGELTTYIRFAYMNDAWQRELRYELVAGVPRLTSAGPDGCFDTEDDIAR